MKFSHYKTVTDTTDNLYTKIKVAEISCLPEKKVDFYSNYTG